MAKDKAAKEAEPAEKVEEEKDLYERELAHYRAALKRDRDQAIKRYGFTLYHSLSNEEKIELLEELKFRLDQPEDDYNEGVLAYTSEDYKKAKGLFEKAYKANEKLYHALYNLALTFEGLGNMERAIKTWEKFLEHPKASDEDKAEVEKHIKELKKQK